MLDAGGALLVIGQLGVRRQVEWLFVILAFFVVKRICITAENAKSAEMADTCTVTRLAVAASGCESGPEIVEFAS